MAWIVAGVMLGTSIAEPSSAADGFERYAVILERMPFGEPPPPPVAPAPSTEEEPPAWADGYRLCSVVADSGDTVRVALLDLKTNKPILLTLGSGPAEGIELLAADVADEEARLRKDGQTYTMKLEASRKQVTRSAPSTAAGRSPTLRRTASRGPSPAALQRAANARRSLAAGRRVRTVTRAPGDR